MIYAYRKIAIMAANKSVLVWHPDQPMPKTLQHRFWAKVETTDTCWIWTGGRFGTTGYGAFVVPVPTWRGVAWHREGAHRLAYELTIGRVPDDMYVLHSCDTPECVRPEHLRVGTSQDNADDRSHRWYGQPVASRRRLRMATIDHRTKLSEEKARLIRERYAEGETMAAVAKNFSVNYQTVWAVLHGRTWASAGGPVLDGRRRNCVVDASAVRAIRKRHESGESLGSLARAFGLSKHAASEIVRRRTWRHLQ